MGSPLWPHLSVPSGPDAWQWGGWEVLQGPEAHSLSQAPDKPWGKVLPFLNLRGPYSHQV